MTLLKRRPKVRVRVPRGIRPGTDARVEVLLDCDRPVEVRAIDIELEGVEAWQNGEQGAASQSLVRLRARLSEARTLPAGLTELPVTLPIPKEAPASYRSRSARIEYELRVHIDIPWWPDRHASFEVRVLPEEKASPPPSPQVFSSNPSGPLDHEPHVELSVASTWTRPGDAVSGALALSNVSYHRYSEVRVGLRAIERHIDREGQVRARIEGVSYEVQLSAANVEEGEMIPFRFRLPADASATFGRSPRPLARTGLLGVDWELTMTVTMTWGRDLTLRVPFSVLPRSASVDDAPGQLAPPTVGSDRLRNVWESVGAQRNLRYEGQGLFAQYGETALLIRRDHGGRDGVHLTAELRFPPLHLRLHVEPARSPLSDVTALGAKSGHATFDRDHIATGRDPQQTGAFLAILAEHFGPDRVRRFDDNVLIFVQRDNKQSRGTLAAFADRAVRVASTLEATRQALPPPSALVDAIPLWEDLAARIGGSLETARMRVEGSGSGIPISVSVSFDSAGVAETTWLRIEPPAPLDAVHELRYRAGDPEPAFKGEALDLFRLVMVGARELSIESHQLALELEGLLGVPRANEAASITPEIIEQRIARLVRLAAALRGVAGPYR